MELIKDLLYIFITAAVPVLTTYLCKFLYTKWTESKSAINNETIQNTLNQVVETVLRCVEMTNQTFVDSLKQKGEFTQEAASEAFQKSKEAVLKLLSEDAKKIIAQIYGNIDVYLDTLIESAVRQLKD